MENGPGAALRLLNFLRNISKTAPEAASRPRLKYRQNARFTSTAAGTWYIFNNWRFLSISQAHGGWFSYDMEKYTNMHFIMLFRQTT